MWFAVDSFVEIRKFILQKNTLPTKSGINYISDGVEICISFTKYA